jgi:DNA-binding FadR family transcriptional regulator
MELLSRSREDSLQTDVRRKASVDAHRRIIAAIEMHDKGRARGEMLRHIEQVERSVGGLHRGFGANKRRFHPAGRAA